MKKVEMDQTKWGEINVLTMNDPKNGESTEEAGTQYATYRVIEDIPAKVKNYKTNYLKYGFIISTVLATIFLIIIIVGAVHNNNECCIATSDHSTLTNNDIGTAKSIGNGTITDEKDIDDLVQLILNGNRGYAIFDVNKNDTMLFVNLNSDVNDLEEEYGNDIQFRYRHVNPKIVYSLKSTAQSDGENRSGILFEESRVSIQDMVYDHIGENLYVIDDLAGSLIVIDVKTEDYDVLFSELMTPQKIELDPYTGLLFILQESHSILRGHMDGSSMTSIVKNNYISAMTLDRKTHMLYWIEQVRGIMSSDYEGRSRLVFATDAFSVHGMTIVNKNLFWLWQEELDEESLHHLVTCKIENGVCGSHAMHEIDTLGDVVSIRMKHSRVPNQNHSVPHACRVKKGGCQQLCLLLPDGGHKCGCKLGWYLAPDQKTCREIKDFMLYAIGNYFKGRVLETSRNYSTDVILPTPYEVKHRDEISFEYDQKNDTLYFSDSRSIYTMKLKSKWEKQTILLQDNDTYIKDIAYDWTSSNLYYIQGKYEDDYKLKVMSTRLGSNYTKTLNSSLTNFASKDQITRDHPSILDTVFHPFNGYEYDVRYGLKVFPTLGQLFYSTQRNYYNILLHRVTANGTRVLEINEKVPRLYHHQSSPTFLDSDQVSQKIYWIDDNNHIKYANLDGTDIGEIVPIVDLRPFRSIAVHKKWMYLASPFHIGHVDKLSGYSPVTMIPVTDNSPIQAIAGMKIVSRSLMNPQYRFAHPCNNTENGGCEQFCFMHELKVTCACRDGETLGGHGDCFGN